VQAAQQLQSDPGRFPTGLDPARLARGRALAQRGAVRTDDEGASHTVRAGKRTYTFRHGHICPCDDRTRSQRPCQHELAVAVHLGALGLGAAMFPAMPEASATPAPRAARPTAATWPTSEAPASMNVQLKIGNMQLMYTARDTNDRDLRDRMTKLLPWLAEIMAACDANYEACQQAATRSHQQAEAER
jgi:hypothetical protein